MPQPAFNASRRQLFRGDSGSKRLPMRPPWAVDETLFTDACSRCGDCIGHCPEQILVKGSGGFPEVDFQHGECTFCGSCADICKAPVFNPTEQQPWPLKAIINDHCITQKKVVCRSCAEHCDVQAISFKLQLGGIATAELDPDQCTGCGACIAPCPVQAINIQVPSKQSLSINTLPITD